MDKFGSHPSMLVICGTDTDVGKTVLSALLLAAFPDRLAYWKPVETGEPDSEAIARLVPGARVVPRLAWFRAAVAPQLAAEREGGRVPRASEILAAIPAAEGRTLVLETFGSPVSPLNEHELQVDYLCRLESARFVLVTRSRVGAIGQALQSCCALQAHGIVPHAIVLLGDPDPYAEGEIAKHCPFAEVLQVAMPEAFGPTAIGAAGTRQRELLRRLLEPRTALTVAAGPPRLPSLDAAEVAHMTALDRRYIWHPFTPLHGADDPLLVVGAQDEFLFLADGRKVVDAIGSWWTILHGHRFPPLVGAARAALERLDHVHFAGNTHPDAVRVAELLLRSTDWPEGGRVFFSDNGSTAVEVAVKITYQYWRIRGQPERTLFIGFQGGYHGDTVGAMSVSRDRLFFAHFEPLLFEARILPLDAEQLDRTLRHEGERIAGIILEPLVQGASGMRFYSAELLRRLISLARGYGVVVIADEVLTGLGRTGAFWACQKAGACADIICSGKTLAGGLFPCAATLVRNRIVGEFEQPGSDRVFYHGHTFTAHPIAMAVAARNIEYVQALNGRPVRRIEAFFDGTLAPLRTHRNVQDVRILGNIAAVELRVAAEDPARVRRAVIEAGLRHDVLFRPLGAVVYAIPPWCVSDESLERIANALAEVVWRLDAL